MSVWKPKYRNGHMCVIRIPPWCGRSNIKNNIMINLMGAKHLGRHVGGGTFLIRSIQLDVRQWLL